jgi:hypothetical protein
MLPLPSRAAQRAVVGVSVAQPGGKEGDALPMKGSVAGFVNLLDTCLNGFIRQTERT